MTNHSVVCDFVVDELIAIANLTPKLAVVGNSGALICNFVMFGVSEKVPKIQNICYLNGVSVTSMRAMSSLLHKANGLDNV